MTVNGWLVIMERDWPGAPANLRWRAVITMDCTRYSAAAPSPWAAITRVFAARNARVAGEPPRPGVTSFS